MGDYLILVLHVHLQKTLKIEPLFDLQLCDLSTNEKWVVREVKQPRQESAMVRGDGHET